MRRQLHLLLILVFWTFAPLNLIISQNTITAGKFDLEFFNLLNEQEDIIIEVAEYISAEIQNGNAFEGCPQTRKRPLIQIRHTALPGFRIAEAQAIYYRPLDFNPCQIGNRVNLVQQLLITGQEPIEYRERHHATLIINSLFPASLFNYDYQSDLDCHDRQNEGDAVYDFYSIMLHEFVHILGVDRNNVKFLKNLRYAGKPLLNNSCTYPCYTLDSLYLSGAGLNGFVEEFRSESWTCMGDGSCDFSNTTRMNLDASNDSNSNTEYCIDITEDYNIYFSYDLSGTSSFIEEDLPYYRINGAFKTLAAYNLPYHVEFVQLKKGDQFCFGVRSDGLIPHSKLTIRDFNFGELEFVTFNGVEVNNDLNHFLCRSRACENQCTYTPGPLNLGQQLHKLDPFSLDLLCQMGYQTESCNDVNDSIQKDCNFFPSIINMDCDKLPYSKNMHACAGDSIVIIKSELLSYFYSDDTISISDFGFRNTSVNIMKLEEINDSLIISNIMVGNSSCLNFVLTSCDCQSYEYSIKLTGVNCDSTQNNSCFESAEICNLMDCLIDFNNVDTGKGAATGLNNIPILINVVGNIRTSNPGIIEMENQASDKFLELTNDEAIAIDLHNVNFRNECLEISLDLAYSRRYQVGKEPFLRIMGSEIQHCPNKLFPSSCDATLECSLSNSFVCIVDSLQIIKEIPYTTNATFDVDFSSSSIQSYIGSNAINYIYIQAIDVPSIGSVYLDNISIIPSSNISKVEKSNKDCIVCFNNSCAERIINYEWNTGSTERCIPFDLSFNEYQVSITDQNDCERVYTLDHPNGAKILTNPNLCSFNTDTVCVDVTGMCGDLNYNWFINAQLIVQNESCLVPSILLNGVTGSYTIRVEVFDQIGNVFIDSAQININDPIDPHCQVFDDQLAWIDNEDCELNFCEGDSLLFRVTPASLFYTWSQNLGIDNAQNEIIVTEEGLHQVTVSNGCDNVVDYRVTHYPTYSNSFNFNIENGDTIFLNGEFFTEEGMFEQMLTTREGCDSLLIINIREIKAIVYYDFDDCLAWINTDNNNYAEFLPKYPDTVWCASVVGSNAFRHDPEVNLHSCTPGLNGSKTLCFGADPACDYDKESDKALIFEIEINSLPNTRFILRSIGFHQKAPLNFDWINGATGPNNYPTMFGIRILLNGSEIEFIENILTSNDWKEEMFSFSNVNFQDSTTIQIELLPYCPAGLDSPVSAWDIDDFIVKGNCRDLSFRKNITGHAKNINGKTLSNVNVRIIGPELIEEDLTDLNGEFIFPNLNPSDSYDLSANDIRNYLQNVSTLDLIHIQKHILGIKTFDETYQFIAGDINNDNKVSTIDIIELRKTILGINEVFPNNASWRFFDKNQSFTLDSAFDLKENISVDLADDTQLVNNEFLGIKIGDINPSESTSRSNKSHVLNLNLRSSEEENTRVDFQLTEDLDLYGLQMALTINTNNNINLIPNEIDLSSSNYNIHNNEIRISWNKNEGKFIQAGQTLFSLQIDSALDPIVIEIADSFISEIYTSEIMSARKIVLNNTPNEMPKRLGAILVYPNPSKDEVHIEYDCATPSITVFEVLNLNGQRIFLDHQQSQIGKNEYVINKRILKQSGTYLLRVMSEEQSVIRKIIRYN